MPARVGLAVLAAATVVLACLAWHDGHTAGDADGGAGTVQEEGSAQVGEEDAAALGSGGATAGDQGDRAGEVGSRGTSSGASQGQGSMRSLVEGDVGQVATRLLVSYRSQGTCVLAHAGYLDLLGCVWGCVVRGDGWVDICVVSQRDDRCQVDVTRLDATEVENELEVDGKDERR